MRELTEPEAQVYAAAFAICFYFKSSPTLAAQEAQKAVQALREARAGHPASRCAWERMLADFRMQESKDGAE